ncbi:MAG: hypothetical protein HY657_16475 [Acidobacteria bacterium]|nr:hypothetical protein [Acidobacteriota bacterium]
MRWLVVAALALGIALDMTARAQGRGAQTEPSPAARAAAPIDLTGTWDSIVSEDWRWRMVTPAKGDYASVPITAEAKRVADAWDPAADTAAGEQCKAYGAAAIMRVPTRLRISWQDDNTLKVETDAGMQTRLLRFAPPQGRGAPSESRGSNPPAPAGPPTWQGHSVAEWETPAARGRGAAAGAAAAPPGFGSLNVVTTHMRPGYLRKNGIPYSASAMLTEHWDVHREPNGDQWLVVTSLVDDPMYLQQQYVTSPNFKKEPDESKWDPTPCSAT